MSSRTNFMIDISFPSFLRTIGYVFVLLCVAVPLAGAQPSPALYPVSQDGQWGYIDAQGTMVINPQFDDAAFFSDGWARVRMGDSYKFIDSEGAVVLAPNVAYVGSFSEGLAVVRPAEGDKLGYLDKNGAVVIEPRFEKAFAFSEGRAAVYVGDGKRAAPKFGYITTEGTFAIEPQFWGARRFEGGLAPVLSGGFVGGTWGFIDTTGKFVIEPQFEEALPFSEGRAAVASGEGFDAKWGFIDERGQVVVEPKYNLVRSFKNGRAPVEDNGYHPWRYIDAAGAPISRERYEYAEPFRGSLARVSIESGGGGFGHQGGRVEFSSGVADADWTYIDTDERHIWPSPEPVPRSAEASPPSVEAGPVPSEQLKALLPASLLGRSHGEIQTRGNKPYIRTSYQEEASLSLSVILAYGAFFQESARKNAQSGEADPETLAWEGHTLLLQERETSLAAFGFPGNLVLGIRVRTTDAAAWDPGAAREQIGRVLDAMDVDQLEAFRLVDAAPALGIVAPAGFETFTGTWSSGRVGLAYPKGWTVTDLYAKTKFVQAVSIVKSAAAANALFADGRSLSTNEPARLVTPENAIVTVMLPGTNASEMSPKDLLGAVQGAELREPETLQSPTEISLNGATAAVMEVRGRDADDRSVVSRRWVLTSGDQLVYASILMTPGETQSLRSSVEGILGSIVLDGTPGQ